MCVWVYVCVCACVTADRSTGERLAPPVAFKRMLDNFVLPRIAQMAAGSVRAAMQTKAVARYFAERIKALRWVFKKYSSIASDQGLPDNRDTVNLMEFCSLLQDSRLLRDELSHTHSSDQGINELSVTVSVVRVCRHSQSAPHAGAAGCSRDFRWRAAR